MMIQPIKRLTNRPVGLVISSKTVLGEWGVTSVADSPRGAALYAWQQDRIMDEIKEGNGRARFWKKRYVAFELDGRKIYGMRDILSELEPEDAFSALREWAAWIRGHGANISSLTSTSKSLWQSTLNRKLVLAVNRLPMPRDSLIIGGRQEAIPGVYDEASLYDISGAYQDAMRRMLIGRAYRHTGKMPYSDWAYVRECVGFARAEIYLPPDLVFGPLPMGTKNARFPKGGRVEGIYDLAELRLAKDLGARVYISEAWIGRGLRFPWHKWSLIISEGRQELPGRAATLAKFMGNCLWGSFSTSGRGSWVHWVEHRAIVEWDKREVTAPCRPLSAHIAAFVRCRLYREALQFYSAGPWIISAHTDGVILQETGRPNGPIGLAVGEWRKKTDMEHLVCLTAQAYKYRDPNSGKNIYVVAGTPPEFSPSVFRAILEQVERRRQRSQLPRLLDLGVDAVVS